jgi:two-component sensor histidine kinase
MLLIGRTFRADANHVKVGPTSEQFSTACRFCVLHDRTGRHLAKTNAHGGSAHAQRITMQNSLAATVQTNVVAREEEEDLRQLLDEKDLTIREIRHRISNNLQILASILSTKARYVRSEEARSELEDAHRRVLSVAAIQHHLDELSPRLPIDVARYLSDLCATLTLSLIGEDRPVSLTVEADSHAVTPRDAASIGLIVTELVMNALKHAFSEEKIGASVVVSYRREEPSWTLTVCDNGVGNGVMQPIVRSPRLGARLVELLAKQLNAQVTIIAGPGGTTVSVTHASTSPAVLFLSGLATS